MIMKIWRLAFFVLLGLNLLALLAFIIFLTTPAKGHSLASASSVEGIDGHSVMLNVTKADFEGIANTYIQQEMANSPIPLTLAVNGDVSLSTEIEIFSVALPILLRFDPLVQEDG